jgi:DNA-binding response OmpR family regulator
MRVLVVEDDGPLAEIIAHGLRREAFAVDVAYDGRDAMDRCAIVDYDLIVLDRNLPRLHGDTVCERLATQGASARILMLTASADVGERVEGLLMGADDYLPKPFAMPELVARLRALARRTARTQLPVLRHGDLWLDPGRRQAGRGDTEIKLANRELAVLETLLIADGGVVTTETLTEHIWDNCLDPFSNAVRVAVLTLRRKLGDPPIIVTVDRGYRLA